MSVKSIVVTVAAATFITKLFTTEQEWQLITNKVKARCAIAALKVRCWSRG